MSDPSSPTSAAAYVAWFSAVALAFLGVDYYALLGAFGGVLFTLSTIKPGPRWKLVATVAITTFVAAALGQGLAELLVLKQRALVIALSVVVGAGGQVVVQAAVGALVARIQKLGGA